MMTNEVMTWWTVLCTVAIVNIGAWSLAGLGLSRSKQWLSEEDYRARRLQLLFSGLYVFGCAYRSVFPVFDVPRLAIWDTWLSSALVGRTVATVAEVAFVIQWALMLREVASATGSRFGLWAARVVVPAIVVAELFSWYSVLTTANIGHVLEESIWGAAAALMVISIVIMRPRSNGSLRYYLLFAGAGGIAYASYMFLVDVPMYWSRWIADQAAHREYFTIVQGAIDAGSRWIVTHRWEDWASEVTWMTLYFSAAVWFSISMVLAPTSRSPAVAINRKTLSLTSI